MVTDTDGARTALHADVIAHIDEVDAAATRLYEVLERVRLAGEPGDVGPIWRQVRDHVPLFRPCLEFALEASRMEMVRELRDMPYDDYLRTDHWQTVRKAALKRSGYRCAVCNSSENLDVHHRTYRNRGQENDTDVIPLCRPCHARHHGKPERD